jgi:ribonuclease I
MSESDGAALRELETEAGQQHAETQSSEQSLQLFTTRYEGGVDTYLQVITWQTAACRTNATISKSCAAASKRMFC